MSLTQGEAVFQVVRSIFPQDAVPETRTWSDEHKQKVYTALLTMFRNGEVNKSSGGTDDASLLKYIPGLVNNWVRKDPRMNGGAKYTPKNPGVRKSSGDAALKAMGQLLEITTDPEARAEIQAAIDARILELNPPKKINVDALPEALRKFV
jgi:hypothetical protein